MGDEALVSQVERALNQIDELRRQGENTHAIAADLVAFVRSELGYDSDSPGNVNRLASQVAKQVGEHEVILRGKGNNLGLVATHQIVLRSWWSVLVAAASMASYILGSFFPLNGN